MALAASLRKAYARDTAGLYSVSIRNPMTSRLRFLLSPTFAALICIAGAPVLSQAQTEAAKTSPKPEAVLTAPEATKLLPTAVFYRGQSATTQTRNSGGVRFADGFFVVTTLVDNSGYSTSVKEKYQAYFITEVPLEISGQKLSPGAYGVGFIEGEKFVVTDIGAHDVFTVSSTSDAAMKRPTPLQVRADPTPQHYRLYAGRKYITFSRSE
jgi:hypothetical protein